VKRFWDTVTLTRDGETRDSGEHRILLDGKPINLPNGGALRVGPVALAAAIAEEWCLAGGTKGGEMSFADTPLTRIAATARERIAPDPTTTADAISRYGETDLLCYRAETPRALADRQAQSWQPWLDWAALTFDAPLRITNGVVPVKQHRDSLNALRRAVGTYDPYMLAGLGIAVPVLGSLVLGLALAEAQLDATEAYALSALDELFQAEQWGEDDEAAKRREMVAADVAVAERFMRLARTG
jgi:chaperone required for assembly of F1-ATPase